MKKLIMIFFGMISIGISMHGLQKELESVAKAEQKIEKRARELSNEIIITDHALKQMEDRGVSRNDVEKAIKYGARSVRGRDKSIKYLRDNVMVVMDSTGRRVITVYPSMKDQDKFLTAREKSLKVKKEKDKRKKPTKGLTGETKDFVRRLNP